MKRKILITVTLTSIALSMFTLATFAKTNKTQALAYNKTCSSIQTLINNAATGSTVRINGDYVCDTKLTFNKPIKLVGNAKLIAEPNIGGIVYDFNNNQEEIIISGITFDVNNQPNVTGISFGANANVILRDITVTNCKDIWCVRLGDTGAPSSIRLNRITVSSSTNSTFESVLVMNTSSCLIQNNTFTNLTQGPAALALYVGAKNCTVRNNNYVNNTIRDFYSSGADTFLYTGNVSTAATSTLITAHGIQIFNTRNATFTNNILNGQNDGQGASGGFIIYDYNVGLDGHNTGAWATSSNIYIEGNTINKSYSAVSMPCVFGDDKHYEKQGIYIRNNTIIDPLWKAIDIGCPQKDSNMSDIVISGNIATGTTKVFTAGNFSLTGASTTSIRNVTITNNTGLQSSAGGDSSCIFIDGVSNVTISGNQCDGVSKGLFTPIQINASTTANIVLQ